MKKLSIIGAGAAGMFCAARLSNVPNLRIEILEQSNSPLKKVLASGGGRCNFTNFNIDKLPPKNFYPRGAPRLRKAFKNFGAMDCAEYFRLLGTDWILEDNGRVFPRSEKSESVANALLRASESAKLSCGVSVSALEICGGSFNILAKQNGEDKIFSSDFVLFACGGTWRQTLKNSLEKAGHTFVAPAPSLFAMDFQEANLWETLAGISVEDVELSMQIQNLPDAPRQCERINSRGAFLFTHKGASGPAILELSSRAARQLQQVGYKAEISANFLPKFNRETLAKAIDSFRISAAKSKVKNASPFPFAIRIWEEFVLPNARVDAEKTWANFSKEDARNLILAVSELKIHCTARASHKGEFVTCGGVNTDEVDFSTMQSKLVENLFFAGECLDIDAVTGGFNLQAAWTTAKICADCLTKKVAADAL